MKKVRVFKEKSDYESESESESESEIDTCTDTYTETDATTATDTTTDTPVKKFTMNTYKSLAAQGYKEVQDENIQNTLTKDQIAMRIKDHVVLKTQQDMTLLYTLKTYNTWIKYFNTKLKKFKMGGILTSVDHQLRYIMLANHNCRMRWKVNLQDNVIFVHEKNVPENYKYLISSLLPKDTPKEEVLKENLLTLYKNGKLDIRKN